MNINAIRTNINVERVRPSAVAGSWYSKDSNILENYIDNLLNAAKPGLKNQSIHAIIAPHAGYQYSGATAADAYNTLRGTTYQRVIILGPAHYKGFHGLSIDPVDNYETPLGLIALDNVAIDKLRSSKLVGADLYGHKREHSIEMQLPFLQRVLSSEWKLLPILVGELYKDDYAAITDLLKLVIDKNTLLIASSDFTHYGNRFGYQPFPLDTSIATNLELLDMGALNSILAKDGEALLKYKQRTGITICGITPISILLRLLPSTVIGNVQTYTTSGQLTGDYNNSVSYMSIVFQY